ncbi:hypothetical protein GCM10009000_003190 [Halobacterium noricense]
MTIGVHVREGIRVGVRVRVGIGVRVFAGARTRVRIGHGGRYGARRFQRRGGDTSVTVADRRHGPRAPRDGVSRTRVRPAAGFRSRRSRGSGSGIG